MRMSARTPDASELHISRMAAEPAVCCLGRVRVTAAATLLVEDGAIGSGGRLIKIERF